MEPTAANCRASCVELTSGVHRTWANIDFCVLLHRVCRDRQEISNYNTFVQVNKMDVYEWCSSYGGIEILEQHGVLLDKKFRSRKP